MTRSFSSLPRREPCREISGLVCALCVISSGFATRGLAVCQLDDEKTAHSVVLSDRESVPTNLVLISTQGPQDWGRLVVLDAAGADTDITMERVENDDDGPRHRLSRSLDPSTSYTLCRPPEAELTTDGSDCVDVTTDDGITDDEAPDAPEVVITGSRALFLLEDECTSAANGTVVSFVASVPAPDVAGFIVRGGETASSIEPLWQPGIVLTRASDTEVAFEVFSSEGGSVQVDVRAVDLSGNISDATVIDAGIGCPGACNASSRDPSLLAWALGLFAWRFARRRRHV